MQMSPSPGLYPGVASKVESQESTGIRGKLSSPPPRVPLGLDPYKITVDLGRELLEPRVLFCDAFYQQQEPGKRKPWFPERHLPGPVMAQSHPGRKAKASVICHPGGALLHSRELPVPAVLTPGSSSIHSSRTWTFSPGHSSPYRPPTCGSDTAKPTGLLGTPAPSPQLMQLSQ